MITFIDLKDYLAPYVDGGVCPDDPRVKRTVDEAIERLVNKPALAHKLLLRHVKMNLRGSYITLPRCFDRILKARIDGVRSTGVYSVWYEFMDNGPGPENLDSLDLVDSGEVVTQYDPPEIDSGYYLIAFSDSLEDVGKEVLIRGLSPTGAEVRGPYDTVGETLKLSGTAKTAVKTYQLFNMITNVRKPVTVGYVFLAAVNPADGKVYHLASYGPTETSPSYRRYQINGLGYRDDSYAGTIPGNYHGNWNAATNTPDIIGAGVVGDYWVVVTPGNTSLGGITTWELNDLARITMDGWVRVAARDVDSTRINAVDLAFSADLLALVRMRPVPITHDTDFLLVNNRACLKAMCQAIYYYDKGDAERGAAYEVIAEKILMDETISYSHSSDDALNIQMDNWATGTIPNFV